MDAFVGARIREGRTGLGLSQTQIADALGISFQQEQKYETGANRVSAGKLFELAQFLNVDIGYFFDGFDEHSPTTALEHGGRQRATISLYKNFSKIEDNDVRRAIIALVNAISKH